MPLSSTAEKNEGKRGGNVIARDHFFFFFFRINMALFDTISFDGFSYHISYTNPGDYARYEYVNRESKGTLHLETK